MPMRMAKIAVSAATYSIDRPFDYLVPEALRDAALPGTRVSLPFGKGNRRCEGVILSVADKSERENLKCIDSVLDPVPVLDEELIKLAFFIRDRFFCTVYDAVKAMLPAGLWFTDDGKRRVNDQDRRNGQACDTVGGCRSDRGVEATQVAETGGAAGNAVRIRGAAEPVTC